MSVAEKILIAEGGKRQRIVTAGEITLEDIAYLGVFLDELDQKQLVYAEGTARHLLQMIRHRRHDNQTVDDFQIDVPDLSAIAARLNTGERRVVLEFWSIYIALVKHLLPEAVQAEYHKKRRTTGVRYTGQGWV